MSRGGGAGQAVDLLAVVLAAGTAGAGGESLSDAGATPCVDVDPTAWRVVMCAVRDIGGRLDWLGAVDVDDRHPGATEVVVELVTEESSVLVRTRLPARAALSSVRDVFAAAAWHEREAAEFVGVIFDGGDPRPLLLAAKGGDGGAVMPATPLRRRTPLAARLDTPWPGAGPDGGRTGRRPPKVPGVHPQWRET